MSYERLEFQEDKVDQTIATETPESVMCGLLMEMLPAYTHLLITLNVTQHFCKYKCYYINRNCSTTIKAMFIKDTKQEWSSGQAQNY